MGKFPLHLGSQIKSATVENAKVHLHIVENDGRDVELVMDHVIGATGFQVSISRLGFIDATLREQIRTVDDTPVLSRNFESSVPGLYLVGVASANSFGPLTRFAYGAKFTARHISKHLAKRLRTPILSEQVTGRVDLEADRSLEGQLATSNQASSHNK
jgi:thioredoxin reductase